MEIHKITLTHKTADVIISALRFQEEHPGVDPEDAEEARLAADLILTTFDRQHKAERL